MRIEYSKKVRIAIDIVDDPWRSELQPKKFI